MRTLRLTEELCAKLCFVGYERCKFSSFLRVALLGKGEGHRAWTKAQTPVRNCAAISVACDSGLSCGPAFCGIAFLLLSFFSKEKTNT